jgi:hypothetical protein
MSTVMGGFPSAVGAALRGIGRAVRARAAVVAVVAVAVIALDVLLPPLLLSAVRTPWTYFTFNPWLRRLPEYVTSSQPWSEKVDFLSRVALFWFSADGPYGAPEWGFAVDATDTGRFVLTGILIGVYVALWLERRAMLRSGIGGGTPGAIGACVSVLGLSTGPCSVVGCGAPVLPVVGLVFAGLSSTTLAVLSQVSRISAIAVIAALLIAIAWLGWQSGRAPRETKSAPVRTGALSERR